MPGLTTRSARARGTRGPGHGTADMKADGWTVGALGKAPTRRWPTLTCRLAPRPPWASNSSGLLGQPCPHRLTYSTRRIIAPLLPARRRRHGSTGASGQFRRSCAGQQSTPRRPVRRPLSSPTSTHRVSGPGLGAVQRPCGIPRVPGALRIAPDSAADELPRRSQSDMSSPALPSAGTWASHLPPHGQLASTRGQARRRTDDLRAHAGVFLLEHHGYEDAVATAPWKAASSPFRRLTSHDIQ